MASPPRLPNLGPKDMAWLRWVTARVQSLETGHALMRSNIDAAGTQRQGTQTAVANTVETADNVLTINVPEAAPQVPVGPVLVTDHSTVTITWTGNVYSHLAYTPIDGEDLGPLTAPAIGFNSVNVLRADAQAGPYTLINYITNGATSIVDANVRAGSTYWYRFVTIDNLGNTSDPGPAVSILVKGVDLGTLATDVTAAIKAAKDAGVAGQNAAAAANAAAGTADSKAAQALQNASTAQSRADSAYTAAQTAAGVREVFIGTSQPSDTSGNVLWIDTTNSANTPKRYNGSAWVAVTDKAVIDAANAAANAKAAADAAQSTANNAVNLANAAQTSATNAQNTANGKNKVNYSVNPPSVNGSAYGDLWFQYSAGVVIGQWFWDNTNWQPKQLDNQIIANLDAGKITAGIISADRIGANTITAGKMVAGTINAASGILADAVITTAKIADLAVSSAKIADLDAAKIQAGTITGNKIAGGTITAGNIAAGTIDTDRLTAGAVTAAKISGTAIDGMTITGAVFRTSGNATYNGVVLDSSGLRGYQNGSNSFYVDSNGNAALTGYVNATGGNFTGNINAQSGFFSGTLTVNGALVTQANNNGRAIFDGNNFRVVSAGQGVTLNLGSTADFSNTSINTAIRWTDNNRPLSDGQFYAQLTTSTAGDLDIRAIRSLTLVGGAALFLTNDGNPQVYSSDIRNRVYASSNRTAGDGNRVMVVTPYGTLGALTGVLNSNYTSSSSRRFKHDIEDWRPDVRRLLELNPVRFKYNDGDGTYKVGMIAEQMDELGFDELVSRNDDGAIQTIEYLVFGAALLHVAREQQKTIDNLEQRLTEAGI